MPTKKKTHTKQLQRVLFSHHRHTGRHLPHEHTSYTLLVILLVYIGVILAVMSQGVAALNYGVNASVKGDPPIIPALILDPTNDTNFRYTPKKVSGTCPPQSYVKVYRNNVYSGSSLCSIDDTFELPIDLFAGPNHLQARVFNFTDDEGPQSSPVTVYYIPPDVPPVPGTPLPSPTSRTITGRPAVPAAEAEPFLASGEMKYQGHYIGQEINWEFEIIGGKAPYTADIDWGDGNNSKVTVPQAGKFTAPHTYKHSGGYKGSFLIKVKVTDRFGAVTYLQTFAIVNNQVSPTVVGQTSSNSSGQGRGTNFSRYLWIIWPAYTLLFLRVLSLWLAERHRQGRGLPRGPARPLHR
ncbi:MAG: hypothetical protein JWL85_729 [Candidatus Saccharibacteria bacterium]|nr:hypothetical protein [Candidatus Saccharibacteria bacterium]